MLKKLQCLSMIQSYLNNKVTQTLIEFQHQTEDAPWLIHRLAPFGLYWTGTLLIGDFQGKIVFKHWVTFTLQTQCPSITVHSLIATILQQMLLEKVKLPCYNSCTRIVYIQTQTVLLPTRSKIKKGCWLSMSNDLETNFWQAVDWMDLCGRHIITLNLDKFVDTVAFAGFEITLDNNRPAKKYIFLTQYITSQRQLT